MIVLGGAGVPAPMPAAIEVKPRNQLTDKGRRGRCSSRSRAPSGRHSRAGAPCRKPLGCLGRELDVWSQDNGVDRASLLTEATVDAFHHIDVEASGPTSAVATRPKAWRNIYDLVGAGGSSRSASSRLLTSSAMNVKSRVSIVSLGRW